MLQCNTKVLYMQLIDNKKRIMSVNSYCIAGSRARKHVGGGTNSTFEINLQIFIILKSLKVLHDFIQWKPRDFVQSHQLKFVHVTERR